MNVLPGLGFDNLRNLDVGRVYNISYSGCQISNDGLYILPDGINVEPVLNSEVDYSAEVFSHFDDYKSATAVSLNVAAKYSGVFSSVSGKFSTDYQSTKSKMVNSKSHSVRVGLRHHVYSVHINPDTGLHPSFKSRILDIAANIQNNNTELAHFLTDLLIRDYGTHVVTSVEAGASLHQTTFLSRDFIKNSFGSKIDISTTASASFFDVFSLGLNFTFSHSHSKTNSFRNSTTYSHAVTHGGPPFKLSNFSYRDWENGLLDNLVAIDRRGQPIYSAITSVTIPELPPLLLSQTIQYVDEAVSKYYKINTHYGCTDPSSPNFNFQANIDDNSCHISRHNHTFGGIYQTCSNPPSQGYDVCEALSAVQNNPLTGQASCPEGYHSVLLHTGTLTKTINKNNCKKHCKFLIFNCRTICEKDNKIYYAKYHAYWCAFPPNTTVPPDSGYMFGGVYTSKQQNPLTGARSCPMSFYPLHFGEDIKVCVSNDIEGAPHSLPFGGFMSCTKGNPLAATSFQFLMRIYPHHCPSRYSQFLLTVDQGCIVNYCTEVLAFNQQSPHPPRLPPYKVKASLSVNVSNTLVLTGPYGTVWVKGLNGEWELFTEGQYNDGETYLQAVYENNDVQEGPSVISKGQLAGAIVGSIIGTVIVIGLIALIATGFVKLRIRPKKTKNYIDNMETIMEPIMEPH
jgi:hypothetical protein